MLAFLVRRLAFNLAVLLVVLVAVALVLRLAPVDPVDVMTGSTLTAVPTATKNEMRRQLGIDGSAGAQVKRYLVGLAHGRMGDSLVSGQPVRQMVTQRLSATVELTVAALIVAIAIAVPVGVVSALWRDRWPDYVGSIFTLTAFAVPSFLMGIMLIYVFSVRLGWLPSYGRGPSLTHAGASASNLRSALEHLCLPALALGLSLAAVSARMIRSALLEALRHEYVMFARAKGLPPRRVLWHAGRNALIPVLTVLGLQLGYLLGGAFLVENVFAWPGLGQEAVVAIRQLDYTVVQGVLLVSASLFLTVNLVVDALYAVIDPRIRIG